MSSGGSRVSIPNSIRKTIQDIKEITGKHSEDDIYVMLKECHMDPNETAQRLLYLDTFHEVKKKRDRRKVVVNGRVPEEFRWTKGMQGRGTKGGQGSLSYLSYDAAIGRNGSIRKENGVINRMERGAKPSLTVPGKTENNLDYYVTNSSNTSVNVPTSISDNDTSHECRLKSSVGGYFTASDPVVAAPVDSQMPGVDTVSREPNSQRIGVESAAINLAGNSSSTTNDVTENIQTASGDMISTASVVAESKVVKINQPTNSHGSFDVSSAQDILPSQQLIDSSQVVVSDAANLAGDACKDLNISALEDAAIKVDTKLEKLNISACQPVIFPDHLQVPEDLKNGLTFGSLDATFEQSSKSMSGLDGRGGSLPATQVLQGNDIATTEPSPSCGNPSVSSNAGGGDCPDNSHSLPIMPESSSHLENVSAGAVLKQDQAKQEIMLPQGGSQYPFVHPTLNYGFPFFQPILGSQFLQCEGPQLQSGNAPVSSATSSMTTAIHPVSVGQSVAVSPPPFPVLRESYAPNFIPFSPYFPPFYLPSNTQQFFGQYGFPQQPSTGNMYLSPTTPASGIKLPVTPGKPEINSGNPTQVGVPSVYGSYNPSLAALSGSTTRNEDLTASELKEKVYTTAQQYEGMVVWLPASGRELPSFYANSLYNQLPQMQHSASTLRVGHGPYAGVYHTVPGMPTTSSAYPLLQQSPAMTGSADAIGPPSGAYQ